MVMGFERTYIEKIKIKRKEREKTEDEKQKYIYKLNVLDEYR